MWDAICSRSVVVLLGPSSVVLRRRMGLALQDARFKCSNNRSLSGGEVQTLLVDLKKEVSPKLYKEVIGKMNAWNVDTSFST